MGWGEGSGKGKKGERGLDLDLAGLVQGVSSYATVGVLRLTVGAEFSMG